MPSIPTQLPMVRVSPIVHRYGPITFTDLVSGRSPDTTIEVVRMDARRGRFIAAAQRFIGPLLNVLVQRVTSTLALDRLVALYAAAHGRASEEHYRNVRCVRRRDQLINRNSRPRHPTVRESSPSAPMNRTDSTATAELLRSAQHAGSDHTRVAIDHGRGRQCDVPARARRLHRGDVEPVTGRMVLIVDASSGIGFASALAERGEHLMLDPRTGDALDVAAAAS